jgi:hypothetical protein
MTAVRMKTPPTRKPGKQESGWVVQNEYQILAVITILAMAVRYSLIDNLDFVIWDGAYYIRYFRDAEWQWVLHPGYPFVIECVRLFVNDGVLAAQIVSLLFGGLLTIPLYFLARHFLSPSFAIGTTIVAVFNPWMVRYGAATMSEAQYIFLATTAFALYFKERPLLSGIAGGLAYLTRPEALVFVGILCLYELFRRRYTSAMYIGIGCILLASPYLLYLKAHTGDWTLTPKTMNVRIWDSDWRVNVARERLREEAAPAKNIASAMLAQYPERFAGYGGQLLTYGGIPLVLFGIYGAVRRPSMLLAGLALFFILPLLGLNLLDRLILPYIPILSIYGMAGARYFPWKWSGLFIFLAMLVGPMKTLDRAGIPEERMPELRTAGLALKASVEFDDAFMDRKPYTAFYAGGRFIRIPNEPPDTVFRYMRDTKTRFLVLSERVIPIFRPQLQPFLYDENLLASKGLRTIYVNGLKTGYGVRIAEFSQ